MRNQISHGVGALGTNIVAQGTDASPEKPPVPPAAKPESLGQILTTGPWFQRFMLLSVVFMPFQYALTVPVGFPLKISEVLVIM